MWLQGSIRKSDRVMGALNQKVCIVTGAGGGIGSAICKLCACEGASAVIAVEHHSGSVEAWKAGDPAFDKVIPYTANLENEQDVKALVQFVKKNYGKIDVLVNSAGIEFNEKIGMISYSHMEQMFAVNVFALIELVQYCARIMMRQKDGSIINIASVVGVHGNPGQAVYSATKGAVISFTKSASKELAPYGIRVNAIAPGLTETKMIKHTSAEELQARISRIGLGRMASPNDIAQAAVFLASDRSDFITGQILGVDGGTIM